MKKCSIIKTFYLLLVVSVFIPLSNSCNTVKQTFDPKDLSYLYNPTKNPINPRFNVVNQSDESSNLSVKFFANDLFFSEANPQGIPTSSLLVTVKLYNISQGRLLSDTVVYNLNIIREEGRREYVYTMPLKVKKGIEYITEVKILDRLRQKVVQAFVPFNTLSYNNKYNFRAQGLFDGNELFNPVLRINEYINLIYLRAPVDSIYISYYKPFTDFADPPSLVLPEKVLDYEPEKVVAIAYSDTTPMMFPREGIYLCTVGRDIKEGYTFFNMGATYPTMSDPKSMIEPLSYLASQNELSNLKSALKPKFALDDFWIKCGGNVERARELIRIYYTRVLYANYYFTSYKEGWRTERGMIYIIYGPPDKVYKSSEGESWGYRNPVLKSKWGGRYTVSDNYLFFSFKVRNNNFSDNDYYLSRGETLVTNWDKAILSWRKGIVFRLDNPEGI